MPLSASSAPLGCSAWAAKAARSASSGRDSRPWGGWVMLRSTLAAATSVIRSASAARCRVMVSSSGFARLAPPAAAAAASARSLFTWLTARPRVFAAPLSSRARAASWTSAGCSNALLRR